MTAIHGVTHSPVTAPIPPGACDCHVHVFGPSSRFPFDPTRAYTPADASIEELLALHAHLGIDRVVIVHPSPYGTDNRIGLDALERFGKHRARAVAVIDARTTDAELQRLHDAGTRGARANLATTGIGDPNAAWRILDETARRVAPLGWHLQTFTSLDVIDALAEQFSTLPVPLVIDHFGGLKAERGLDQPGFAALRRLVASGRAYVKLSAAYRSSQRPDAADLAPFARALLSDNPERCVWGTDWPHPGGAKRTGALRDEIEPFQPIDDGAALNRLAAWCRDPATLKRVLVDNPARLYDF